MKYTIIKISLLILFGLVFNIQANSQLCDQCYSDCISQIIDESDIDISASITNKGYFSFDVPEGNYKIEFVPEDGLTKTIFGNKNLKKGHNYLDIKIN